MSKTELRKKLAADLIEVADRLSLELAQSTGTDSLRVKELLSDWYSFKETAKLILYCESGLTSYQTRPPTLH